MTTQTTGLITEARQAFAQAIRAGSNGAAEHAAWQAATATAVDAANRAREQFEQAYQARVNIAGQLQREARDIEASARYVGRDVNNGSTFGGSRIYTEAEHEAKVSAWLQRASDYLGRPVTVVDPAAVPLPPLPRGEDWPPVPVFAPVPDYATAVQLAASGKLG